MAVTLTSRFGLPQWGTPSDTPSRDGFNQAFAKIDAAAARDLGAVGGTALPTTGLTDGMYAQTVDGPYRRLHRRAGGAWSQVGGNAWAETIYLRADAALASTAVAYQVSHPSLANPGAVQNWDGTSVRGGRQAIGDVNTGAPGALHVGDTASAVDLAARGRVYARTTADGQRGVVASAHGTGAGPLFTAREPGGTDPWQVDARGRMRAQAPASFGAADLTTGVPLVSAPGASDVTAADFYAAASKAALRVLRALGDTAPIGLFEQDRITLGRTSWAGGRIDLIAPTVAVTGPLSVSGAAGFATVNAGQTTVTTLRATSTLQALSVAADNGFNAEGGRIYSQSIGSGATVLARPSVQYSGSNPASLRQPVCQHRVLNPALYIVPTQRSLDVSVTMHEDGWMRLDSVIGVLADQGNSNTLEPMKGTFWFDLRSADGSLIETGYSHIFTVVTDDTSRQSQGQEDFAWSDIFWTRLAAGTYTLRVRYANTSILSGYWMHARFIVTPVVLGSVTSS